MDKFPRIIEMSFYFDNVFSYLFVFIRRHGKINCLLKKRKWEDIRKTYFMRGKVRQRATQKIQEKSG